VGSCTVRTLVRSGAAALFVLPLLVRAQAAGTAHASVQCGDTLTTNTTLTADLGCSGTALKIGAPKLTLNLGGHTLRGDGTGVGVDNSGGHDEVTIQGGTIQGFAVGVLLSNASNNPLTRLTVRKNVATQGAGGVGISLWLDDIANTIPLDLIEDNEGHGTHLVCDPAAFHGTGLDCHNLSRRSAT
jgi:hypothetical protein